MARGGTLAWLGSVDYDECLALQKSLWQKRVNEEIPDTVLTLEHPHVITIGRTGNMDNLLVSSEMLEQEGTSLHVADRGGDITYHGPGQLICYPIIYLGNPFPDLDKYLRRLEQVVIDVLSVLGVRARRIPGATGVWTKSGKIAAIGVKVTRGVTYHGFSLNLDPDLSWYQKIIPCGLNDRRVTSVRQLTGTRPDRIELLSAISTAFTDQFGIPLAFDQDEANAVHRAV